MSSVSVFRGILLLAFTPSQLGLEVASQTLMCLLATWQEQAGPEALPAGVCVTSLIETG